MLEYVGEEHHGGEVDYQEPRDYFYGNSLRPSDANRRQYTRPLLVEKGLARAQAIIQNKDGLSKLDHWAQKAIKFKYKYNQFHVKRWFLVRRVQSRRHFLALMR